MKRSIAVLVVVIASLCDVLAQNPISTIPPLSNAHPLDIEQDIRRPRLTMIGFDSPNQNYGLGVKQVLEKVYISSDPLYTTIYERIVVTAGFVPVSGTNISNGNIDLNSRIFQARAFEALMTYILEENGYDDGTDTNSSSDICIFNQSNQACSHMDALNRFKAMAGIVTSRTSGDSVHKTRSISNTARGWDLYMALEVAYFQLNGNLGDLMNTSDQQDIRASLQHAIELLRTQNVDTAGDAQPGNWPLKVKIAAGYGSFGLGVFSPSSGNYNQYIGDAFESAFETNWNFSNNNGKRYWAEGSYYLFIAAGDVLPFWHAMRNNAKIPTNIPDPFSNGWFLNAWNWAADISMPGGYTPPIDDGNKWRMDLSSLLRWSPGYGNNNQLSNTVANKFAWINESLITNSGIGSASDQLVVEISMPRRQAPSSSSLPTRVKNNPGSLGEFSEQQLIVRENIDGEDHFILLNGEQGEAIIRGEGHEQPDNMQLLYNIDGTSFLFDSGYDSVPQDYDGTFPISAFERSSWNNYHDHNAMRGYPTWFTAAYPDPPVGNTDSFGGGGMIPPFPCTSNFPICGGSDHTEELYHTSSGEIDILHSKITLVAPTLQNEFVDFGTYKRDVLFVKDPSRPYLIDLNKISDIYDGGSSSVNYSHVMTYHGNSTTVLQKPNTNGYTLWEDIRAFDGSSSGKHLYLYADVIEKSLVNQGNWDIRFDNSREQNNTDRNLRRLDIWGNVQGNTFRNGQGHSTVAFLEVINNVPLSPAESPKPIVTGNVPAGSHRRHQAWKWQINANMIDVFAAHSAYDYSPLNSDNPETRNYIIPEANNLSVTLPANKEFGFVRLKRTGKTWAADSNYQLNLTVTPAPALNVSCSGPTYPANVPTNSNPSFTGSISGGFSPYTYFWDHREYCQDLPPLFSGPGCGDGDKVTNEAQGNSANLTYFRNESTLIRLNIRDNGGQKAFCEWRLWVNTPTASEPSVLPKRLSPKVVLAGSYDSLLDKMKPDLYGYIPLSHPFNDPSLPANQFYGGFEKVTTEVLNNYPDIIDWVLVDVIDDQSGTFELIQRRAGLLKANGEIVDINGFSPISFHEVPDFPSNYHIAIRHRNHLAVMNPSELSMQGSTINNPVVVSHDFNGGQAYTSGGQAMIEVEPGVWAMHGGDGSQNGSVSATDFLNHWLPQNGGPPGYHSGDFNLSSSVTAFDFLNVWLPSNGQSTQVPSMADPFNVAIKGEDQNERVQAKTTELEGSGSIKGKFEIVDVGRSKTKLIFGISSRQNVQLGMASLLVSYNPDAVGFSQNPERGNDRDYRFSRYDEGNNSNYESTVSYLRPGLVSINIALKERGEGNLVSLGEFEDVADLTFETLNTRLSPEFKYERCEILDGEYSEVSLNCTDFLSNEGEHVLTRSVVSDNSVRELVIGEPYPNPFNPRTQFNLVVPRDQSVTIELFDKTGRKVATIFDGFMVSSQPYTIDIDGSNFASGSYFYRIQGEDFSRVKQIMLLK